MTENKFLYETLWRIYEPDIPQFISQLAETNPMQRLKQVGMNCGCEYVALHSKDMCRRYTRFEHSIGVALIIWHFTHHPQQAVAGLFHDISTPAFAHVVDFLNGDHLTQESTEQPTFDMIDQSPEIQTILGDLGLSTADVCNYHLFPIADNSSPQLSADRLEYTLGNFIQYHVCGTEDIERYFNALTVGTNEQGQPEIVFSNMETAEQFAMASMNCSYVYISDADRFTMQYLAEALKKAIQAGALTPDDLYTTEENVIARLRENASTNAIWEDYINIRGVCRTQQKRSDRFCCKVNAKRRYLDPYVPKVGRVTEFSEKYRAEVADFLSMSFEEWLCKA